MDEKIKLIWLPKAFADIERIYNWHSVHSQQGANRLLKRIFTTADTLSVFPTAGRIESHLQRAEKTYRSIVVDKRYKLIYRIGNNGTLVITQGIWPCKRDPQFMSSFNGWAILRYINLLSLLKSRLVAPVFLTPQRGWMKTSPLRPQAKTDCCKTTGDYSDFKRITYNP